METVEEIDMSAAAGAGVIGGPKLRPAFGIRRAIRRRSSSAMTAYLALKRPASEGREPFVLAAASS